MLEREMDLFPEWFLVRHLGLAFEGELATAFADAREFLTASALEQPRTFVHRDYHSRNLMVAGSALLGRNPGVLDFQDAVYGPVTYDLVSLLRDCYIAWPLDRVHRWMAEYLKRATHAHMLVDVPFATLRKWFDLMGIQRHLKAIGIFSRLCHRDGKRGYLSDIPRTLRYIQEIAPEYAPLRPFAVAIEEKILPALGSL
jgi:aminoglycoside/choline kinase family phosphotransferase